MTSFLPSGNGTPPPDPKTLLARLRTSIGDGRHWVFLADLDPARFLLRALAEYLTDGGRATASQVSLIDVEHVLRRPLARTHATVLVVAKSALPASQVVEFVGPAGAADISRGSDVFLVGACPAAMSNLVCDIAAGRYFVPDPRAN